MTRLLAVILLCAATLAGQPMTGEERQELRGHLRRTSQMLFASMEGVSAEQWAFQPAEGQWSIGEVAEHLALAESFLLDIAIRLSRNELPERRRKQTVSNQRALAQLTDRARKSEAPDPLKPSGTMSSEEVKRRFLDDRRKTLRYIQTTGDDMHNSLRYSQMGDADLDPYQRLLFISAHVERHVNQIDEIKAHPAYPR